MILWRAAGTPGYFGKGSCWAERRQDAIRYMDNPGHGGAVLYKTKVDLKYVLDLTNCRDPYRTVAKEVWEAVSGSGKWESEDDLYEDLRLSCSYPYEMWENNRIIREALASMYDWIRYQDDYPYGCITLVYLGSQPIAAQPVARRYSSTSSPLSAYPRCFYYGPMRLRLPARIGRPN